MMALRRREKTRQRGATLVEYALLILLVGVASVAGWKLLQGSIRTSTEKAEAALDGKAIASNGADGLSGNGGEPPQGAGGGQEGNKGGHDEGGGIGETLLEMTPFVGSAYSAYKSCSKGFSLSCGFDLVMVGADFIPGAGLLKAGVKGGIKAGGKLLGKKAVSEGAEVIGRRKAEQEAERTLAQRAKEGCVNGVCTRPGQCFAAGTLVATASGAEPIETLRVGDRVRTIDDDGQEGATEIDPRTWKLVRVRMSDGAGETVDLEVLRSEAWVEGERAIPGAFVPFELTEMGISGEAEILSIAPSPPIAHGPGRVVAATIVSTSNQVHVLRFADGPDVLELTARHPLFSVDRREWVRAGELAPGERIYARGGPLTVTSNDAKEGAERVYNLEVESEHTYLVGAAGVLSHNSGVENCVKAAEKAAAEKAAAEKGGKEAEEAAAKKLAEEQAARLAEKQGAAAEALEPLKSAFPDAKAGFRGSLARGRKGPHKGNAPFNPKDFDVDAFIVSDKLASAIPANAKGFRNLARDPQYGKLVAELGDRVKGINGVRSADTFKVRVFSEKEFAEKVGWNERYLLK